MASTNFPFGTAVTTGEASFSAAAVGDTPLIVTAAAGQTADIVDVVDSTGATKYLKVNSTGNVLMSGTLTVSGASTLTGNVSLSGTLSVTGAATLPNITGPTTVTGAFTVTGGLTTVINLNATGQLNAGSASVLAHTFTFDSTSGAVGIKLVDVGAGASSTPNKFLRVGHVSGNLDILNNGYSAVVSSFPDAGGVQTVAQGGLPLGFCPPMYALGGTTLGTGTNHMIFGQTAIAANSAVLITITGTGNAFTSTSTYAVFGSPLSAPASGSAIFFDVTSASTFTIVNNTTGALTINWVAIGY